MDAKKLFMTGVNSLTPVVPSSPSHVINTLFSGFSLYFFSIFSLPPFIAIYGSVLIFPGFSGYKINISSEAPSAGELVNYASHNRTV